MVDWASQVQGARCDSSRTVLPGCCRRRPSNSSPYPNQATAWTTEHDNEAGFLRCCLSRCCLSRCCLHAAVSHSAAAAISHAAVSHSTVSHATVSHATVSHVAFSGAAVHEVPPQDWAGFDFEQALGPNPKFELRTETGAYNKQSTCHCDVPVVSLPPAQSTLPTSQTLTEHTTYCPTQHISSAVPKVH
jgi:hypothetical protein